MNKDDYLNWRNQDVTREYLEAVIKEMDALIVELVNFAGDDAKKDMFRRGAVVGLKFLAEWQPDFQEEEEGETDDAESIGAQDTY